jgi:hypothetical protein
LQEVKTDGCLIIKQDRQKDRKKERERERNINTVGMMVLAREETSQHQMTMVIMYSRSIEETANTHLMMIPRERAKKGSVRRHCRRRL